MSKQRASRSETRRSLAVGLAVAAPSGVPERHTFSPTPALSGYHVNSRRKTCRPEPHRLPESIAEVKLIFHPTQPNVHRVLMFMREKRIKIEMEIPASRDELLHYNPLGQIPVLVLDDGTPLAESISICRYLEDLYPTPRLLGGSPREKAIIDMWQRRVELRLLIPAVEYGHHTQSVFEGIFQQYPEWGESNRGVIESMYELLARELENRPFIGGARFSIADITAYCGIETARLWGIDVPAGNPLLEWRNEIKTRPSAGVVTFREAVAE